MPLFKKSKVTAVVTNSVPGRQFVEQCELLYILYTGFSSIPAQFSIVVAPLDAVFQIFEPNLLRTAF